MGTEPWPPRDSQVPSLCQVLRWTSHQGQAVGLRTPAGGLAPPRVPGAAQPHAERVGETEPALSPLA